MKISFRLSTKVNANGMSEIMLSAQNRIGKKVITLRAKSEVYIIPAFFSKEKGIDLARKKVVTNDMRVWHNEAKTKIDGILSVVANAEILERKENITGSWLKNVVEHYLHPERFELKSKKSNICELAEEYIQRKGFAGSSLKRIHVIVRAVLRFEKFIQLTDKAKDDFHFDIDRITRDDLENFRSYLKNEKYFYDNHPNLFNDILQVYNECPYGNHRETVDISSRGDNYIANTMKRLKAFFNWMYESGKTTNRPFDGFKIGLERYGTPYYITIDERNVIAETPMPTRHLETQRDIFIFQCFVGCRVSDLVKLTEANITNGILEYTPHKTKDEGEQAVMARIPLHPKAVELMERYKGMDGKGRLFPFISPQKYNDAIKEIFTIAGITRNVEIRNAKTGEMEIRPINEIASSHLARRTFIGNAYKKVSDPNIIGKMSGHVEGSKAFSRYRNIEDETLKNVIDQIG